MVKCNECGFLAKRYRINGTIVPGWYEVLEGQRSDLTYAIIHVVDRFNEEADLACFRHSSAFPESKLEHHTIRKDLEKAKWELASPRASVVPAPGRSGWAWAWGASVTPQARRPNGADHQRAAPPPPTVTALDALF